MKKQTRTVIDLLDRIGPLLHGHHPDVQGAVLADLLAMWLAGHFVERGGAQQTERYREELLQFHIEAVRKLIPANEAMILRGEQ